METLQNNFLDGDELHGSERSLLSIDSFDELCLAVHEFAERYSSSKEELEEWFIIAETYSIAKMIAQAKLECLSGGDWATPETLSTQYEKIRAIVCEVDRIT